MLSTDISSSWRWRCVRASTRCTRKTAESVVDLFIYGRKVSLHASIGTSWRKACLIYRRYYSSDNIFELQRAGTFSSLCHWLPRLGLKDEPLIKTPPILFLYRVCKARFVFSQYCHVQLFSVVIPAWKTSRPSSLLYFAKTSLSSLAAFSVQSWDRTQSKPSTISRRNDETWRICPPALGASWQNIRRWRHAQEARVFPVHCRPGEFKSAKL